jgi:hypothetical protein
LNKIPCSGNRRKRRETMASALNSRALHRFARVLWRPGF